jgi:urease accessory protein
MLHHFLARGDAVDPFTVAVSGTSGSGRPMLLLALCRLFRDTYNIAVVTTEAARSEDGCREFLIRHKALAPARIPIVLDEHATDTALDSLAAEFRPELVFLDRDGDGCDWGDSCTHYTIHVVDGSADAMAPYDIIDVVNADLLVVNQTRCGPPLREQRTALVREYLEYRGEASTVFTQTRYGIGTIEVARQFLESWRRERQPLAWAPHVSDSATLTQV